MIQVPPSQVTPQLRELFNPNTPASLRCFAVLDRQSAGQVWFDTLPSPNLGIVREAAVGSLYFGGAPDAATINDMIASLKNQGDVLIGLWPEDDLWLVLPPNPDYVGSVLEFNSRVADESLSVLSEPIPEGCQLSHINNELIKHRMMKNY